MTGWRPAGPWHKDHIPPEYIGLDRRAAGTAGTGVPVLVLWMVPCWILPRPPPLLHGQAAPLTLRWPHPVHPSRLRTTGS